MIRIVLIGFCLLLCGPAQAQSPPVHVKTELSAETTTVGQPLILRVTVLVPTWLPEPPRFPSLEMPNVIVRLPSRASSPVSETIEGETWSGVSRAYRLYPMIEGSFSFTPQPVGVTYAAPDTREPVSLDMPLDPITFGATVPEAAGALDPLILAESFSLAQSYEGGEGPLQQGEAVTRIITAKISGTSALFIPPLIPALTGEIARAYPKEPGVKETEDRGLLSGSRQETVRYLARYGGVLELPGVSVDWFNIKTQQVETATLEGLTVEVDAPPVPRDALLNRRQSIVLFAAFLVVGLGLAALIRYVLSPLRQRRMQRRAAWLGSEDYAAKQVKQAIGDRDLSGVHRALAFWSTRVPGQIGPALQAALAEVGATFYRNDANTTKGWPALSASFQADRARRLQRQDLSDLPSLNGF